jgi:D-serine deaminase-like pyridoxal phosphate-dependent protein
MTDSTVAENDYILDWRHRTFPTSAQEVTRQGVAEQGWNLLQGDLLLPAMVLKESALEHNVAVMRRFCERHGVDLAPHGKTTMSPEIVERQLRAGAWAITAATVQQARVFRGFGVQRIVIANQVVDPASVRWLAAELAADPGFDCYCLADSVATVEAMERELSGLEIARPIPVLVELGVAGGRTGARGLEAATAVAEAIARSSVLRLTGVEAYEGVIGQATIDETLASVDRFLDEVRELALALDARGLFDGLDEILLTAGGSAFFDRVVDRLNGLEAGRPVRLVLRSGCYVTHDSAFYRSLSPLDARAQGDERLVPALQAWGAVVSRPEPGLALVGFGKRDVPYDLDLPVVELVRRRTGEVEPLAGATVTALNDQHAFVALDGAELEVGDWIGCGISHPCTAFDKWRAIPVVDDGYGVVGIARTYF